jgi:hypothetical protein
MKAQFQEPFFHSDLANDEYHPRVSDYHRLDSECTEPLLFTPLKKSGKTPGTLSCSGIESACDADTQYPP